MNSFLALSLGLCLSLGLTWLFARKCARWLDDSWWSQEFGIQVWVTVILSVSWVILPMCNGFANFSHGLIPVGISPSPRPRLRELAAAWRPGPLEVFGWVWLAGMAAVLLWRVAGMLLLWLRVWRKSRPVSARVQGALENAWRTLEGGILGGKTLETHLPDVRVLPGLPGPMSIVLWPKCLLLDREDYDDAALDAILRHELVHACGRNVSLHRFSWLLLGAIFWFVPTVWLFTREARRREEYTCDRDANAFSDKEELRAYAHAITALAAPRRREAFGTANMACGEATLRRRVEALFRAEPALRWWQKALRRLLAFAMPACVLLVSLTLFSGPAHYAIDEENLLNFVGHDILFELSEGMHPDSFPTLRGEDYIFRRLETKTPPYGAAAVYNDRNDIYLSFSDGPAAADAACAQLAARLDGFLGAREDAGEDAFFIEDAALRAMLELPPDAATPRWEILGTWRGTAAPSGQILGFWRGEAKGTATITLARADAETGAVVALLWN